MSDLVGIQFKFPNWLSRLESAEREINLFIAAQMQTNRGLLFDNEGSYNGHAAWAPLKFRDGVILSKRGDLRKSIAPQDPKGRPGTDGIVRFDSDTVTIGTKKFTAAMMNWGTTKLPGGVLRPKKAKALRIPLPEGKSAGPAVKAIQAQALEPKIAAIAAKLSKARTEKSRANYRSQLDRIRKRISKGKGPVDAIFVKSVKIPERRFDTWTSADQAELEEALTRKIIEVLNRG